MKAKAEEKVVASVRLPADIRAHLDDLCETENRTISEITRDAITHYLWNRDRNQRSELWARVIDMLQRIGDPDPSGPESKEFVLHFLNQFGSQVQVDRFLEMPDAVIQAAIKDAFDKFEPIGEVPDIYPFNERMPGE